MLALTLATALAAQPAETASADAALQLCRPALAKRVSGDISAIAVGASSRARGWTVIRGSMRALIGMGDAPPGSASTHHLIRADYGFICWVTDTRVRKTTVNRVR